MEVQLPKLAFEEMVLSPTEPVKRGKPALDVDRVIRIGGPISVPVTVDAIPEDDETRPFIESWSTDFSFHLVHVACTVLPDEENPLEQVSLDFVLSREDGTTPSPVALSMAPARLEQPVELSRTIKLGGSLRILNAEAQRVEKSVTQSVHVEALNELRSNPSWRIYRTDSFAIKGMQNFAMVVKAPKAASNGTLTVKATVARRRLGIFPYTATHEGTTPITFTLQG